MRGRIHGRIGRLLQDVNSLEEDPHGMGGIRDAAVRESVRAEEVGELVVDPRFGRRQNGQQNQPQEYRQQSHRDQAENRPAGESVERIFQGAEPAIAKAGSRPGYQQGHGDPPEFDSEENRDVQKLYGIQTPILAHGEQLVLLQIHGALFVGACAT